MNKLLLIALVFIPFLVRSQTNVRAWYAQGQVWVVWQISLPIPETFAIYKKATPFSSTTQATPIGRLFDYEYLPGTFWQQTGDTSFTYRIPTPNGSTYQLQPGEGLFVETITASGSAYYAVVEWGNTAVEPGINLSANAVNYQYNPVAQPVNCHLQLATIGPEGHNTAWFALWALGKTEHWAGRPDFPVMANAAKNGMPSMFIVSQALSIDTLGGNKIPMTHFLHGGGQYANQFLAANFKAINLEPLQGILVSHNDDFPVNTITEEGDTVFTAGRSLWFGWTKAHNPFDHNFSAQPGDTIINYTQRRVMWINDWLIKNFPIDPQRVAIQGYSMGSGGATALAKAFPNRFSTACLFNCGLRAAVDPASVRITGSATDNLPTNLRGYNGEVMRLNDIFTLNTRLSAHRDFPLIRIWNGKNDPNERMHWGPDMVAQLRIADSLGWGTQIQWDERAHTFINLGMYWVQGFPANTQTYRDNLSYQENFNSQQSFPAFFNHRLDPANNDPGIGILGINNGDGDNWGSWGGYHNWDLETLADENGYWAVSAWLTADAVFDHDNCPQDVLTADLAIRKPQHFTPQEGSTVYWRSQDLATGEVLQAGTAVVQADDVVVIPGIEVFKENIRKVRIELSLTAVSNRPEPGSLSGFKLYPNPIAAGQSISVALKNSYLGHLRIELLSADGRVCQVVEQEKTSIDQRFELNAPNDQGLFWVRIVQADATATQSILRY